MTRPPLLLTVEHTATKLDLTPRQVTHLIRSGKFPCRTVKVGRRWMVNHADVLALAGQEAA